LTFGRNPQLAQAILKQHEVVAFPGQVLNVDAAAGSIVLRRGEAGIGTVEVLSESLPVRRIPRDTLILEPRSGWSRGGFSVAEVLDAEGTLEDLLESSVDRVVANVAEPVFAVTDTAALLRTNPPHFRSTGKRIPYGTLVSVTEKKEVDGQGYVRVQLSEAPNTVLGWTALTNLGSVKEFDSTMKPDDFVSLDNISGIERSMAAIYNSRGKYLKENATALGISASGLAAVLTVESGGRGFGNDGRIIVRFENHVFWRQWGRAHEIDFNRYFRFSAQEPWKEHAWRENPTVSWLPCHTSQSSEWQVLEFAKTMDGTAALKSASYGAGQVMGFNHAIVGYDSVQEMVRGFDENIRPQLDAIIAFVQRNPKCMNGLRSKNYVLFASGYNGPGQAVVYGTLIQRAAEAYARITQGKLNSE